ncbi:OPT superfamily, partial [Cryomyces antarcticus]
MAPDRGLPSDHDPMASTEGSADQDESLSDSHAALRGVAQAEMNKRISEPQNFTVRSIIVGLLIGVVIAFSNTYFGLQTGWVSGMAMPSALIGFAFFRTLSKHLNYPFTPVENVLVQTVAGSVGTMPLGCGFVGVVPALEFLLRPGEVPEGQWEPGNPTNGGERGGLNLGLGKLIVWAVGICFFGVVFAVPLRKEVIIREKLKFPSGTATALMIGVLHGEKQESTLVVGQEIGDGALTRRKTCSNQEDLSLMDGNRTGDHDETQLQQYPENEAGEESGTGMDTQSDWRAKIRLLVISFGISGFYTLLSYFIPHLHDIPFLGLPLANEWLWTLNPSPA